MRIVGTALILGLSAHAISQAGQDFSLTNALSRQSPDPYVTFAAIFVAVTLIRAVRFAFIVRSILGVPFSRVVINYPYLFLISSITPFRAGDFYKIYWLQSQEPDERDVWKKSVFCCVVERIMDLVVLAVLLLIGLRTAVQSYFTGWALSSTVLWGSFIVLLGAILVKRYGIKSLRQKTSRVLLQLGWRSLIYAFVLTVMIWLSLVAGYSVIISENANLQDDLVLPNGNGRVTIFILVAVQCLVSVNLIALVSATPANLGTFQAAIVAILTSHGFAYDDAIMTGTLLQLANLAVTIILGFMVLAIKSHSSFK